MAKVTQPAPRLYYLQATARFGRSRNVLLNQIKAQAYERSWPKAAYRISSSRIKSMNTRSPAGMCRPAG
jgi:predicted nuclease of restriction endonuclease-like (RecB) superfamily